MWTKKLAVWRLYALYISMGAKQVASHLQHLPEYSEGALCSDGGHGGWGDTGFTKG